MAKRKGPRKQQRKTNQKTKNPFDEPTPEGEEWIEWGGELIFAVGFTSGGAPFGSTVDEFRSCSEKYEPSAGWAIAKSVLRGVLDLQGCRNPDEEIDYIRFLGEGLTYRAFVTSINFPFGHQTDVVVRIPREDLDEDHRCKPLRELKLLAYLDQLDLPFRVPKLLGGMSVSTGIALVQEFIPGIPVSFKRGGPFPPWKTVGRAAAYCHKIDFSPVQGDLVSHSTRPAHVLSELAIFDDLVLPEAEVARQWVMENLPPDSESSLLHGNLLGQNILIELEEPSSFALIDWEEARIGDPAYDLAIGTRGARKPFGMIDGRERLCETYSEYSGRDMNVSAVRLWELLLLAHFLKDAERNFGPMSPHAESQRQRLASFVRRLAG